MMKRMIQLALDEFVYIYQEAKKENKPTFLLLHGTGGDEKDLITLAQVIDEEAGFLSLRGNINENGMNRFFKREAMGVFNIKNLKEETEKLYNFLNAAAEKYRFKRENLIALGYSNGANIAASLIFHYYNVLEKGILLHPMVPLRETELPDLAHKSFFIGAGKNDPICPAEETNELIDMLEGAGASIEIFWGQEGHSLTKEELESAKLWYEKESF